MYFDSMGRVEYSYRDFSSRYWVLLVGRDISVALDRMTLKHLGWLTSGNNN